MIIMAGNDTTRWVIGLRAREAAEAEAKAREIEAKAAMNDRHVGHATELWQTNEGGAELRYCETCGTLYTSKDE